MHWRHTAPYTCATTLLRATLNQFYFNIHYNCLCLSTVAINSIIYIFVLGYITWRLIHFRKDAATRASNVTSPAQRDNSPKINKLYIVNGTKNNVCRFQGTVIWHIGASAVSSFGGFCCKQSVKSSAESISQRRASLQTARPWPHPLPSSFSLPVSLKRASCERGCFKYHAK